MNIKAFLNTYSTTARTLPIVIFYVTEECNLKCITCSYRDRLPDELSLSEIDELAVTLRDFGLQHIVYSGGEPFVRKDFPDICKIFSKSGVRQTVLTNGLLLEKLYDQVSGSLSEIIVSIDGPNERVHDDIRGVHSFHQIVRGISKVLHHNPRPRVSIRTVVQRRNFRSLPEMVTFARELKVDGISFLAVDTLSQAFGRARRGQVTSAESILLNEEETGEFRQLIDTMVMRCKPDFQNGFISERPEKMFHLVQYFEALIGKATFPRNQCNAPDISAVITSTGDVKPCFFLPHFGNIRSIQLMDLINAAPIQETRRNVRDCVLERCKTCVCTLHVSPLAALTNRF